MTTSAVAVVCARIGCETLFTKKTHNQKYCSDKCCRKATNKKIMDRYYEKKERKNKVRACENCGARLRKNSREDKCSLCLAKVEKDEKQMVLQQIAGIVWD